MLKTMKLFRAVGALLALLAYAAPAAAYDAARAPGYGSGDMYRPHMDRAILHGALGIQCLNPSGCATTGLIADTLDPDNSSRSLATTEFVKRLAAATIVRGYIDDGNCVADQSAKINRLAQNAGDGAWLIFPQRCITVSNLMPVVKQRWTGAGRENGTEFRYTKADGAAFKLIGDSAMLEQIRVNNPGATTSSTAIVMSDASEDPVGQKLSNVYTTGFTKAIDIESGYFWSIDNVFVRNFSQYGVLVRNNNYCDRGDSTISRFVSLNDFTAVKDSAAIRYESGGGLKVTNTKILGSDRGIDLQLSASCNRDGTGILLVSNSSIENQATAAIRLGAAPAINGVPNPKTFGAISIVNNEIAGQVLGIRTEPGIYNVTISGNAFNQNNVDVQLAGGRNIYVGGNAHSRFNVAAIDLLDGGSNYVVGPGAYDPVSLSAFRILDERKTDAGYVARNEVRPLTLPAAVPGQNFTKAYQVAVGTNRGTRIAVLIEGTLQGLGTVNSYQEVLVTNTGAGVTITNITPVVAGGYAIDLGYDTTSVAGSAIIQVQPNLALKGGAFNGTISLDILGPAIGMKVLQ